MDGSMLRKLIALYASYGLLSTLWKFLRGWWQMRRVRKMLANVPQARYTDGPLGAIKEIQENIHRRHDWFAEATAGFKVCKLVRGPKLDPSSMMLCVRDPVVIKHYLKDKFDLYSKANPDLDMFTHYLEKWLGTGIFITRHGVAAPDKGENWSRQRKIASNIFSRGNFNNNMNDVFVAKSSQLCELLRAPAAEGQRVDMQAKFFEYTMDSIMQIFFGEPSDILGGKPSDYGNAYDTAHRCIVEYMLKNAPKLALMKLLPWPFGGLSGIAARVHNARHPLFQEFLGALKTLDTESRRLVAAVHADPNIDKRKDLLALFVQSESSGNSVASSHGTNGVNGTSKPSGMSAEWLRDVVLNFVIAGRDTTACTLSWMFYILSTHPEIQQKVQEEIDAKFKERTTPTIQSLSASELPYLHGVLYETLRLYPPVPVDGKQSAAEDVFPDGTRIPNRLQVSFMIYAMGRDPATYPDPLVVRPERWIPFKEPSPYEFPVFQAGPRICVGMNMAIFEAKIAATMLLREYSFELAPGEADKISYLSTALTMSIINSADKKSFDSHNLWLIPKARQAAAAS